jgi:hypothetical protein
MEIIFEEMYNWHYCVIKYNKGDIQGKVDYLEQRRLKELIDYDKIKLLTIFRINLNEENAKKLADVINKK